MCRISFLLLVSRRGRFPAGFSILGLRCEQSLDAGRRAQTLHHSRPDLTTVARVDPFH
jgi:hypothetical protein